MKLSYYLFKQDVEDFSEIILKNKVNTDNNYQELQVITSNLDFDAKVYMQTNKSREPKWLKFLEKDVYIRDKEEVRNTVNSFIILIKIIHDEKKYFFGITAGFGFIGINKEKLENDFGLKVTLNSISTHELKALDVRNIDLKTKQKRVHINKGSELGEFELDLNQDILNLVSGKCENTEVGTSIRGTTSLNLNSKVEFKGLGAKCRQLIELYLSNRYKENFDFIDNMKIVKNKELSEKLNELLWNHIQENKQDKISLTYPDMIEYDKCAGYKIVYGSNKFVETDEIDISDLYRLMSEQKIDTIEKFKKICVIGLDDSGSPKTSKVSIKEFIVFEVSKESKTYIFTMNNWYVIDANYYEKIKEKLECIEEVEIKELTTINKGEAEGQYNERQDKKQFIYLDKKNFQIPNSSSKVEICDLLSKNLQFICIKRGTASATLSHLFSQGSVSMDLLKNETTYREKVIQYLEAQYGKMQFNKDSFPYNEVKVVYAITSNKKGSLKEIIPFFSKVNLLQHIKRINELGMQVQLCKIKIEEV